MKNISNMNVVEKDLSIFFKKKYCCFTGNGTTAIYLLLQSLNLQNKIILYPAITCTNPVNAAIYAGYKVMFCDVNLSDYTMNIESLEYMIKKYNIGVVVPTHIYGYRCNIKKIKDICKKYDVFVLEDAAQSTYFNEYADASIISFGHTKIFESKHGGGAVFTNNEKLFNKIKNLKRYLGKRPKNSNALFDEYRQRYYSIVNSSLSLQNKYNELYQLQIDSKDRFLFDEDCNESILKNLKKSNEIIEDRQYKAFIYQNYLNSSYIDKPKVNFNNLVPWRYSFLFKGNRNKLLDLVRKSNIDISSWYSSLQKIYRPELNQELVNAEYIEKHIVNLWVVHSVDKIKRDLKIINNIINELEEDKNE